MRAISTECMYKAQPVSLSHTAQSPAFIIVVEDVELIVFLNGILQPGYGLMTYFPQHPVVVPVFFRFAPVMPDFVTHDPSTLIALILEPLQ